MRSQAPGPEDRRRRLTVSTSSFTVVLGAGPRGARGLQVCLGTSPEQTELSSSLYRPVETSPRGSLSTLVTFTQVFTQLAHLF